MTFMVNVTHSDRRTRFRVARLSILILILIVIGFLNHRTMIDSKPAGKSAPYGYVRDSGRVKSERPIN